MQVAKLMLLLAPILEHYREWTVDAMLTDIYKHCCQQINEESPRHKIVPAIVKEEKSPLPSLEELLLILPGLSLEEQKKIVMAYNKDQIKVMAKDLGMKGYSNYNKDFLAEAFCVFLKEQQEKQNRPSKQGELPGINEEFGSTRQGKISKTQLKDLEAGLKEAAESLPGLTARERVKLLNSFTRQEIWQIARYHDLKIPTINTKDNAIRILDNHFNFLELHRDMGNR